MSSHHARFRWTVATQDPTDAREVGYNKEIETDLNSYRALAIVDKQRRTNVINNLRDWEGDATYEVVSPNRSGYGFTATGLKLLSPKKHRVEKPSADEQLAAINFGKLIGSLKNGKIIRIPYAEYPTGAIPVVDTAFPEEMFYYIPAQIEPLTMNRKYFEDRPSFVVMKPGEMPSYVFWKRKAHFSPSYTESELLNHRTARSGAPTPEPRPASEAGPATEPRPASLAVNTDKVTETVREKRAEPEWEVFDPRLEENPIEFLDYYNACLHGRKGVRSKLMLREADIDRVNYISPCLAHNHKEPVNKAGAVAADADVMDIDAEPVSGTSSTRLPEASASKPSKTAAPKPWKQPAPIAADDPSWKNFFARIDREKEIREARIHPKPVFTIEFCNAPGTYSDRKKAVLTRELYDKLYRRAVLAHRELENRSKCCFACGLNWTLCPTTRFEHYKQHREEYKLHMKHCSKPLLYVEDPLRIEDLDAAKAPMAKGIPEINWFRDLEKTILNMENELLEREHVCRICNAHVDFAYESPTDHYRKHSEERKQLRAIGAVVNSVPHTPTDAVIITENGATILNGSEAHPLESHPSEKSSPARSYHGFSRTPEHIRAFEKTQAEQRALMKMIRVMETSAQQLRETGTLQSPISIPSDVSSSAASTDASSDIVINTGEEGAIYSDVIGNANAPLVFPPLFKKPVVPQDNLDFLSESSGSKNANLDFLSGKDADTVAPMKPELMSAFQSFMEKERRTARQNRELDSDSMEFVEDDAHLDHILDNDDDLYASPAPVNRVVQGEADAGQAEIIQAIRTNSGELYALNSDSENVEEVPEEFEVEDAEEVNADEAAEEIDGDEDVEEVPREFGRIETNEGEDFDDDTTEHFWYPPSDEILENPDQMDSPADEEQVQSMTRALSAPPQTEKLDAAKILALATGNSNLRKMNLSLADAFSAIVYVDRLINSSIPITNEREAVDKLVDYIHCLKEHGPKGAKKGAEKAPVKGAEYSFQNHHLNTSDLLNGIRLELYDMWRVIMKTHEAFEDMVAANGKEPISDIKERIVGLTRSALVDTWRYGYKDEPLPIRHVVPVRHDGLDLTFEDLEINDMLTEALNWGCGLNNLRLLADKAWGQAVEMIKGHRTSVNGQSPKRTAEFRSFVVYAVQRIVRDGIITEKRWRKKQSRQFALQEAQATPTVSSAKWSTQAVGGQTPVNSPWTPKAPMDGPVSTSNKRKRPSSLPTHKRKVSDGSFRPGPPTPFNPDEVSPRMPKMPRRSNDPLYRPDPAVQEPTTPPVTPKLNKRSNSNQKAADRAAKKLEKKLKNKQAKKAESKQAKKVSFESTQSSSSSSKPSISSASSKASSPQVVITKATKKSGSLAKPVASKSSNKRVKNVANKSGINKTSTKNKKSDNVAIPTRPKRQAAIEAEKTFGKTRVVE